MGLLDRAIALFSNQQARENTAVESLISSIGNNPGHPDYPRGVINVFRELIGFTSGSIMLLDSEEKEYYPLVSTGPIFDALDVPGINSDLPASHLGESKQITITKFENLLPNLTKSGGEVMILRIGTGNPPSAILLATDYQRSIEADRLIKIEIQQLADRLQDGIESYQQTREREEKREPKFSKRLASAGISKASVVFLNMSDAIEAMAESYSELDTVKAAQKVINLLGRITGRMGRLHELGGERVLIVFPDERLPDHELYLHQLSVAFGLAYKKLGRAPSFQAEFKHWPKDSAYIEKQLLS